jgi:hypothetical protein
MNAIFFLVLTGSVMALVQKAGAGSAVMWDRHGHIFYTYGESRKKAEEHLLDLCHRKGVLNAKLIDSTDLVGYGAIAVARKGSGSVIGISLGRPSPADAENRAKEKCLRAGGINPKVRWGFRG